MTTSLFNQTGITANGSGAGNAGVNGLHFTVSAAATLLGVWHYSPSAAPGSQTQLPTTIALYTTQSSPSTGTLVTSNTATWLTGPGGSAASAGSGWCYAAFTSPPSLSSGVDYMAAQFRNDAVNGWFMIEEPFTWPVSSGILTAPADTGAGQGWFATSTTLVFPSSQLAGYNFGMDVLVSSGNNLTAGALNMSPVQLAGTVTNPVNLTAAALNMSPVQLAGSIHNAGLANAVLSAALVMSPVQLAGTLNNPLNVLAAALNMSPVQLAGELGTQKNVTAGSLLMAPVQTAGTLTNPVNLTSGNLDASVVQVAGIIGTQKNVTAGSLPLSPVRIEGIIGSGGESLTINGQSIMSCARAFTADLSGMLSVPLVRTADIAVPGKHGLVRVPRKLYDRAQIPMTIWVRGMSADNTFPARSERDAVFYENLDTLMQMFAVSGSVTLVHTTPDGSQRQIAGQVLQAITPRRYAWSAQSTGNLQVIIECTDPFWREPATVTDTVTAPATTPVTGNLAGQDGSTAPVEDAVVTFAGPCTNPRLTCGDWYVQYSDAIASGHSVAIDCGAWTVTGTGFTADYSKLVHAGLGPWIVFPPAPPGSGGPSVTYAITAGGSSTCTVAAQRAFLGG